MGELQSTHINAYRAELAQAEKELSQSKGKVASLKAYLKDNDPDYQEPKKEEPKKAETKVEKPKIASVTEKGEEPKVKNPEQLDKSKGGK